MKKFLTLAVVTAFVTPFSALGATPPSTADAARLSDRLTETKPVSKITNDVLVKDTEEADDANAVSISFKLNSVAVEGNTVFQNSELEQFYSSKVGKEVTLAEMYEVRDQITKYYREKGYILSRAIVPAQKLGKDGADFKIRIVEGYINNVSVDGEFKGDQSILDNYLAKIKTGGPLNSGTLERYLLLLNDLPGVTANAVLKPATGAGKTGASDLIIQLTNDTVGGVITVDNSGSKFIGRVLATGEVSVNSILGLSEEIRARGIISGDAEELKFGSLSYKMPIGYEGTAVRLEYGKTKTHPGSTLEPLDFEGTTSIYQFEVTHPFLRTRKENFSGRINFAAKNTETDSLGLEVYDDRTRELSLGATYDLADRWNGTNLFDLSVTKGFDIFNASNDGEPLSRANGDIEFTKINFEARRLQSIYGSFGALFAASGQYAFDGLLSANEFGVGGMEFGRAYDYSEITGDHGVAGKVELQYGFDFENKYVNNGQLYTFYEIGAVWQEDPIPGEDTRDSLSSIGVGTRFNLFNTSAAYFEFAKPLTRQLGADDDHDIRFNTGISYLF